VRLSNAKLGQCSVCGKIGPIQLNHVGGKNHLAWFMMPFCSPACHDRFHTLVRQAGINLEFTTDKVERIRRAQAALLVAHYMLNEQLKKRPDKRIR
jgi:hypothetical protein